MFRYPCSQCGTFVERHYDGLCSPCVAKNKEDDTDEAEVLPISIYSEMAADALRDKEVPQLLLWALARAMDEEGSGFVDYHKLMTNAQAIFGAGYISRLMHNEKAEKYFYTDPERRKETVVYKTTSEYRNHNWRCFQCHCRKCGCNFEWDDTVGGEIEHFSPNTWRVYYRAPERIRPQKLGYGITPDFGDFHDPKTRTGMMLAVYLAGQRFERPLSQAFIEERTGIKPEMQRRYRKMGCFETAANYAVLPDNITEFNGVSLSSRRAFKKDGQTWVRIPNTHLTDALQFTRFRPDANLKSRRRRLLKLTSRRERWNSPSAIGRERVLLQGQRYFESGKKLDKARRQERVNPFTAQFVKSKGRLWYFGL